MISAIFLLAQLFISTPSHAVPTADFAPACGAVKCTEAMKQIENEFLQGHAVKLKSRPKVFTGACYHLAWNMDPNATQYGVALFETRNSKIYFAGKFGFFYQTNPWANMTLSQVQSDVSETRFKHDVDQWYTYSVVNMQKDSPDKIWQYWLSQFKDHVDLVAAWGADYRVFCRLDKK